MVGQCAFSARSSAACCLMGSDLNSYNSDTASAIHLHSHQENQMGSDLHPSIALRCFFTNCQESVIPTNPKVMGNNCQEMQKQGNLSHSYVPCVLLFGLPLILQLLPLSNLIFVCKSWLTSLVKTPLFKMFKLIQFTWPNRRNFLSNLKISFNPCFAQHKTTCVWDVFAPRLLLLV